MNPWIPPEMCAHNVIRVGRRSGRGRGWRFTVCVDCETTLSGRPPNTDHARGRRTDFTVRILDARVRAFMFHLAAQAMQTQGEPLIA